MRLNTYLIHRVQGTQYLIEVAEVASARLRDFFGAQLEKRLVPPLAQQKPGPKPKAERAEARRWMEISIVSPRFVSPRFPAPATGEAASK